MSDFDTERTASWFVEFADNECPTLPLYEMLCRAIALEPDLIALLALAAAGQQRPNLLLAALHDQVLQYPSEPFARLYPTVGGSFDPTSTSPAELIALLRGFISDHREAIDQLISTQSTQTNEVNRSCLWFAALRSAAADLADTPISFIEVGASAGLNLAFDGYRFEFSGAEYGNPASDAALSCEVRSGTPPLSMPLPAIAHRVGIDISPVDVAETDSRRWLKACIWPEQLQRHQRFDAAVAQLLRDPPALVRDDLVDGIGDLIDDCAEDSHIVIVNSWVMTYLPRARRAAFDAILDMVGADRPLTRISAEGEGVVDWVPEGRDTTTHTVVGMQRWRDGVRTDSRLAHVQPHLAWMDWFGSTGD